MLLVSFAPAPGRSGCAAVRQPVPVECVLSGPATAPKHGRGASRRISLSRRGTGRGRFICLRAVCCLFCPSRILPSAQ
jgi:hypothetical protein